MTDIEEVDMHHPVVMAQRAHRAADLQVRLADAVTAFVGSMRFVYLHALAFTAWMLLVESEPWSTLTLVVSLEAIFLSTFVLIGQNRQSSFQQAKADHDFMEEERELRMNSELTRAIHVLATEILHKLPASQPRHEEPTSRPATFVPTEYPRNLGR